MRIDSIKESIPLRSIPLSNRRRACNSQFLFLRNRHSTNMEAFWLTLPSRQRLRELRVYALGFHVRFSHLLQSRRRSTRGSRGCTRGGGRRWRCTARSASSAARASTAATTEGWVRSAKCCRFSYHMSLVGERSHVWSFDVIVTPVKALTSHVLIETIAQAFGFDLAAASPHYFVWLLFRLKFCSWRTTRGSGAIAQFWFGIILLCDGMNVVHA